MNELRARALNALGYEFAGADGNNGDAWRTPDGEYIRASEFKCPSEDTLIGMLLKKLDRLTDKNFAYYAKNAFGDSMQIIHSVSTRIKCKSPSILEALVRAVEAAKEGK